MISDQGGQGERREPSEDSGMMVQVEMREHGAKVEPMDPLAKVESCVWRPEVEKGDH